MEESSSGMLCRTHPTLGLRKDKNRTEDVKNSIKVKNNTPNFNVNPEIQTYPKLSSGYIPARYSCLLTPLHPDPSLIASTTLSTRYDCDYDFASIERSPKKS